MTATRIRLLVDACYARVRRDPTLASIFHAAIADRFACKVRRIAESPKLALFCHPDRNWPEDLRCRSEVG